MKDEILSWINNAIEKLDNNSLIESIHIDKFVNFSEQSPQEILSQAIEVFNKFCEFIRDKDLKDIQLFLQISLVESDEIQGVFKSRKELLENIDLFEMPEIFLYKPCDTHTIPDIEFYRSPIPFKIDELNAKSSVFYKEYRDNNEIINNEPFTREINVVYTP